ncbi:MAG: hypothetical protein ACR2JO_01720 [Mycobacteriales bacterium]
MVTGRTSEPRTTTVTTTTGTAAVTAPAGTFATRDTGRTIVGTGIPAGATIASVASATAATLSANATTSGTTAATIGTPGIGPADAQAYGFTGWSPETDTEAATYTVAAVNALAAPPSRLPDPPTPVEQRGRG